MHIAGVYVKPVVTVGVCVKDRENCIRETLESILSQDFRHELIEVIFVDDGSEDKTLSIINGFVSRMDMDVEIFHHEWMGLGKSRNVVVDNARGDYILWVDGDMVLPKDHVRRQVEFMEQNPTVGISKAKYALTPKENMVAALENVPFMVYDNKAEAASSNLPGTGGAIFRVKAIRQVGGFDSCLKGSGEDQDTAYRVKAAGWLIRQSPAFFYERRVRTWKSLWSKYSWYGYGIYDLYRKNRKVFNLYKMNPVAGFVTGTICVSDAYRLTKYLGVFLLPLHFAFKMAAWCFGFFKAQTKDHRQRLNAKDNHKASVHSQ